MKVKAEDIDVELGNNGITLRIADNAGKHVGRLRFGRSKIRWWKGKASKTVTEVRVEDLIAWLEAQ